MKKGLMGVLSILVVLLCMGGVFAEGTSVLADEISVNLSNVNERESVLVPLREVFSRAGYDVCWDGAARNVRVSKDFRSVVYTISKSGVLIDNVEESVDIAPEIIDNKTYISIDALEKGLGRTVEWNKDIKTVTFKKDDYRRGNWQDILPLEKLYQSRDDSGKVVASIVVRVPQIENPTNRESIEKINRYYRTEINRIFDEYEKLLPADVVSRMGSEVKYDTSYIVTYNAKDMLSVVMVNRNKSSVSVKCDVFDTNTGEKIKLHDIIKVSKSGIDKFKMNAMMEMLKGNESIRVDDIMFFIDDGDLVLVVNKGVDVLEHRIKSVENRRLFKKKLQNTFNYNEEVLAKKIASKDCKPRVRFVDKTIIDKRECYVFEKCSGIDDKMIAVDKYHERVYTVVKKDGAYVVVDRKDVNDGKISDREALGIVRQAIGNNGYTYDLYGEMSNDVNGQVYSVVSVKDLDGDIDKRIAVNKINKSLYEEKSKVLAKLDTNDDGTVVAIGHFEVDNNLTDTSSWGSMYVRSGSNMTIREDGTGMYSIVGTERFKLVDDDGKTYIEIQGEEDEGIVKKGTRFLVEVKEINNEKYLYVHDEKGEDIKPGDKYWKLMIEEFGVFEPLDS